MLHMSNYTGTDRTAVRMPASVKDREPNQNEPRPGASILLTLNVKNESGQIETRGLVFDNRLGLKLPGGAVDANETFAQAAARELVEELFALLQSHFGLTQDLLYKGLLEAPMIEMVSHEKDQLDYVHRDYHLNLSTLMQGVSTDDNAMSEAKLEEFMAAFNKTAEICAPTFGPVFNAINTKPSEDNYADFLVKYKAQVIQSIEAQIDVVKSLLNEDSPVRFYGKTIVSTYQAALTNAQDILEKAVLPDDSAGYEQHYKALNKALFKEVLNNHIGNFTQLTGIRAVAASELARVAADVANHGAQHKIKGSELPKHVTRLDSDDSPKVFNASLFAVSGLLTIPDVKNALKVDFEPSFKPDSLQQVPSAQLN